MAPWRKKSEPAYELITPAETHRRVREKNDVVLLDVRTPEEFNNELGHVKDSLLIPLQELEHRLGELGNYKGQTIIAICRSGNRSGTAAGILARNGFAAMNMQGGMIRWNEEGLPVERNDSD